MPFRINSICDLPRFDAPYRAETLAAISRVLERGWYISGPEVEAFENEFAEYLGVGQTVGVANGSDALLLALRALNINPNKRVAVAANAAMYGTLAVLDTGAAPLFVDVEPQTALMNLDLAAQMISGGAVGAVIVTHLYGRMQDISGFVEYAHGHGVAVIEDCAQSHGARLGNRAAGTVGDIGCFSFYPTKNLGALGDGGALTTNDAALASRIRQLRQYGWAEKYRVTSLGGKNSRLDELQAAILRTRLPHLDDWNKARRGIATRYALNINHPRVFVPPVGDTEYVAHLFVVRVPERDSFLQHLASAGVPFAIHYPVADYNQPAWVAKYGHFTLQETELWTSEVVTLPCFPGMTEHEVDFVYAVINSWS